MYISIVHMTAITSSQPCANGQAFVLMNLFVGIIWSKFDQQKASFCDFGIAISPLHLNMHAVEITKNFTKYTNDASKHTHARARAHTHTHKYASAAYCHKMWMKMRICTHRRGENSHVEPPLLAQVAMLRLESAGKKQHVALNLWKHLVSKWGDNGCEGRNKGVRTRTE